MERIRKDRIPKKREYRSRVLIDRAQRVRIQKDWVQKYRIPKDREYISRVRVDQVYKDRVQKDRITKDWVLEDWGPEKSCPKRPSPNRPRTEKPRPERPSPKRPSLEGPNPEKQIRETPSWLRDSYCRVRGIGLIFGYITWSYLRNLTLLNWVLPNLPLLWFGIPVTQFYHNLVRV